MKEKNLIRGMGFVGDRLRMLLQDHTDLPREWDTAPDSEHIYYLASYGNYYDQSDTQEIYKANLTEPLRLLNQLHDFQSFVFVSTSSVLLPYQTFYSASKRAMEDACNLIYRETNKPVTIVRPSSITGIGEQSRHLIPTLIRSCLYGEEMPFVEEPSHDYIDIDNFCRGLIYLSENADKYAGQIINLSSGVNYTNKQVLELVENITGKKANIKPTYYMRKYDTTEWIVKPTMPELCTKSLKQSIEEMVEYAQQSN